MTADACREWRGALAATALGHAEPEEEVALRAHVDGCAACRAELQELAAVARALPFADPDQLTDPAQPPSHLAGLVVERVATERARRRRGRLWRALAVAAVVVALVAVGAVLVAGRGANDDMMTTIEFPVSEGVTGYAALREALAGTEVRLVASGLDDGEVYWLWLTDGSGERVAAGTFRGGADEIAVTLTGALPLHETVRIWVTDEDDSVVLDAPVRT